MREMLLVGWIGCLVLLTKLAMGHHLMVNGGTRGIVF